MSSSSRSSLPARVDLVVVGAGTAGAAVAARAAKRGLSVVCLDRAPLDAAGAQWVNGVSAWAFDEAEIPRPTRPELRGTDATFHMLAGRGPARLALRDHGVLDVDMRLLGARLRQRALEAGATLLGDVEVHGADGSRVSTSHGVVEGRFLVDASGLAGARLLDTPPSRRRDVCAAAQAVHEVRDRAGARAFMEAHAIEEGDTLCFTGVAGGYSILNTRIEGDEVSLLTGTVPADGHVAGRPLLEGFVHEQPWIGPRIFGGHRAIPLGRPHDVLAEGRVARIGDAARQVFSAHGSGIGAGLVAARMLVDAIVEGGGPEAYGVAWQRQHGGVFAAYDLFRRFSQELTPEELQLMMRAELLDEAMTAAGLTQRLPRLDARMLLRRGPALVEARALAPRLTSFAARAAALVALYARYPRRGSRARWSKAVARIADDASWDRAA